MGVPLAVVIDIDGTIIGEIMPQVIEWQLISQYRKEFMRQYKTYLIDALRTSLIRPGLSDMIHGICADFQNVEFFIYTASEHKWANLLVPCIEAAIGIELNRPIFTRNHMIINPLTGVHQKSLAKVLPMINRAFKKKGYTMPLTLNQCIIIDNNSTLIPNESKRLVLCPTYKYTFYQDVLRFIPTQIVQENLSHITQYLTDSDMFPSVNKSINIELFYAHYYERLGRNMASRYKTNTAVDQLWLKVYKALHKYLSSNNRLTFKDNFIKNLNTKLDESSKL